MTPKQREATYVYALARLCGVSHKTTAGGVINAARVMLSTGELGDKAPAVGVLLALIDGTGEGDAKQTGEQSHEETRASEQQEREDGEA